MSEKLSYFPADTREEIAEMTVGDLLAQVVAEIPDRQYLIEMDPARSDGRAWTYAQVLERAQQVARRLIRDFKPGEHIAIWAPNSPEWVFLYFGAAMAGLVIVPINPAYLGREAEYVLAQSRSVGLFLIREFRGASKETAWNEMRSRVPAIRCTVFFDEWQRFLVAEGPPCELPQVRPTDSVLILYTSGTTGAPKGAVLSHRGIVNLRLATARLELPYGSVWLNFMPMFHISGCIYMTLGALWNRGTQVLTPAFDARLVLEAIELYRANFFIAVPTMLLALLEHEDFHKRQKGSLEVIGSGGATVPAELVHRIQRDFGVDYAMMFGQTETAVPVTHSFRSDSVLQKSQTVGPPIARTEIKIVNPENGTIVPLGTVGEICVRAVVVMKEYFDNAAGTAGAFDSDGWLHTGDLGTLDEEGYCRITGRLKDMIIRGGENIFPREMEEALMLHPGVADAAVFGVPDPRWGEQPVAAVRLRAGVLPDPAVFEEFLRGRLARHKVPRLWQFLDTFPTTPSGKIQKFVLRQRYLEAGATAIQETQ